MFCVELQKMIKLLMLLLLKQAVATGHNITFESPDLCALRGSSVQFRCLYSYPEQESVKETAWFKGELINDIWKRTRLSELPSFQDRFEYRGDLQHNCSLVLHSIHSVYLIVTGLNASVHPKRVRAGDHVTLECKTKCQLPVVWFKDGQTVTKSTFQAQAEDAGKYSCAIEGHESVQSDPVVMNVWYSPLNVSVEQSGSGLLSAGSSLNLTCDSAANPAADNYTWYRRSASDSGPLIQVGSGQVLSFSSFSASDTGSYICRARNSLGENVSSGVQMKLEEANYNLFIVLGLGLTVIILFFLPLIIIWAWRRRQCNSAAPEENHSHDYENFFYPKH
ncbi:B-cell receptor CD22-like isoform X2 [Kryptolebias marmoratus]|uniref:B-cell receptor CD22-like isoform X2 n=1 Tax=Kryptolebias marmoratus TaxID=37003 RepID=UPI000D5306E2|nr:B-cell receptor CD22-like isoform X2 [Kryptolebias marmoratus]XP_037836349.1 B-cell receptor CD22-like isoform X2 [Kryptolebias marmoratus]